MAVTRFPQLMLLLLSAAALLQYSTVNAQNTTSVILEMLHVLREGVSWLNLENTDNNVKLLAEYDFIIVGAGTAGCTLAARLTENPKWKVLLIEAGGPELLVFDIPIIAHFLQLSPVINWGYETEPSDKFCLAMNGNRCKFPRGKVMGGSSVLNYMMYTRGNRRDYDAWEKMGNEGWSYKNVLPYFKKFEGSLVPDADKDYVGRNGPVKISYPPWHSSIADAFIEACKQDGLPYRDYNGKRQVGVSYIQTTTNQQFRWSSNHAYLYPIKNKRPNLHIIKNSLVTKILIDPKTKTAQGVRFEYEDRTFEVKSRLEVISSAGAVNTPQLLMLSGIGPAKHLKEMNIKPLADLAVGFNLQDHFAPFLTFLINQTSFKLEQFLETDAILNANRMLSRMAIPGGVESIAFYELDNPTDPDGWPDMELFLISGSFDANPAIVDGLGLKDKLYQDLYKDILAGDLNAYTVAPMILRPRSRGRVTLKSKNPRVHPRIFPNFFRDPYDIYITVKGMQKAIELAELPALKKLNATLLERRIPACKKYGDVRSVAYLDCYARHFTCTIYHQSGTCKMGPKSDRMAVVDPRLRVHGFKKLRVVDVSVMPKIIAGHPNGPVFMIAEKAADIIKQDYGYI